MYLPILGFLVVSDCRFYRIPYPIHPQGLIHYRLICCFLPRVDRSGLQIYLKDHLKQVDQFQLLNLLLTLVLVRILNLRFQLSLKANQAASLQMILERQPGQISGHLQNHLHPVFHLPKPVQRMNRLLIEFSLYHVSRYRSHFLLQVYRSVACLYYTREIHSASQGLHHQLNLRYYFGLLALRLHLQRPTNPLSMAP